MHIKECALDEIITDCIVQGFYGAVFGIEGMDALRFWDRDLQVNRDGVSCIGVPASWVDGCGDVKCLNGFLYGLGGLPHGFFIVGFFSHVKFTPFSCQAWMILSLL